MTLINIDIDDDDGNIPVSKHLNSSKLRNEKNATPDLIQFDDEEGEEDEEMERVENNSEIEENERSSTR